MTFRLDGVPLSAEYDKEQDVLYLWTGEKPREAVTYETEDGHLVRLDPETREFVGVTILDFQARWAETGEIRLQVPSIEERVLQPA
jgi:uncharacterized protein YuzE